MIILRVLRVLRGLETYLKKQSQFIRTAYCVLRKGKKAKMSVNLEFIRVNSWLY